MDHGRISKSIHLDNHDGRCGPICVIRFHILPTGTKIKSLCPPKPSCGPFFIPQILFYRSTPRPFSCAHLTHAYCIRFITIILVTTTVLVVHGSSNSNSSSSNISKFYIKSSSDPRRRRRRRNDGCWAAGFRIIDSS